MDSNVIYFLISTGTKPLSWNWRC